MLGRLLDESHRRIRRVGYDEADPYVLTKAFLDSPEQFFRHLLAEDSRAGGADSAVRS